MLCAVGDHDRQWCYITGLFIKHNNREFFSKFISTAREVFVSTGQAPHDIDGQLDFNYRIISATSTDGFEYASWFEPLVDIARLRSDETRRAYRNLEEGCARMISTPGCVCSRCCNALDAYPLLRVKISATGPSIVSRAPRSTNPATNSSTPRRSPVRYDTPEPPARASTPIPPARNNTPVSPAQVPVVDSTPAQVSSSQGSTPVMYSPTALSSIRSVDSVFVFPADSVSDAGGQALPSSTSNDVLSQNSLGLEADSSEVPYNPSSPNCFSDISSASLPQFDELWNSLISHPGVINGAAATGKVP